MRQALVPVLHDLESAGIAVPRVAEADRVEDAEYPQVMLWSSDGSGMGVIVSRAAPLSERVAAAADQVQEFVIEELWRLAASTNWPPCPRHPSTHPMRAMVLSEVAVWVCPVEDTRGAAVGTL